MQANSLTRTTYMLIEILTNLLSLNIGYFIGLIANNIVIVFGLVAVSYLFSPKNFLARFVAVIFVVSALLDMQNIHNFVFYTGFALFLVMLARISFLTISESNPNLRKYSPLFYAVASYAVLFYINFFG
jgi:hypothetical protein